MIRKVCRYTTLATLGLFVTLMIVALVALVFGGEMLSSKVFWKIQGTIGTFFAIAIIGINVAELMEQKNVLAIISFVLMVISAIILLIVIWKVSLINEGAGAEIKTKIAGSIPITSALFTLILNPSFKVQNRMKVMQIITGALLVLIFVQVMALIWAPDASKVEKIIGIASGVFNIWIPAFVIVGFEITFLVLGKKNNKVEDTKAVKEDMITIPRSEYEQLKSRINELENKLKQKEE